jgi:hypothetical protein
MPPKSKGLTYATRLRTTEAERASAERVQAWAVEAGLSVSLNDALRHLIRRADVPVPLSPTEGLAAIAAHWETCPDCESYRPPRCLDGLYLRELNKRATCASSGVLVPDRL